MQVEDITWVGFSSWWSSQQQGHLSVSDGLLGKIVIDDKSMSSTISEEFSDGASRIRSFSTRVLDLLLTSVFLSAESVLLLKLKP